MWPWDDGDFSLSRGEMVGGSLPRSKPRGWLPDVRTAGSRTQKREYGNIMSASRELGLLWHVGLGWVSGDMGSPLGSAFRIGRT